ncbi:uncharacterized protein F4822DRAFT_400366 [Hypoxylon trugodes]|uniref:uncharacterized protein n=1 Tax=Hypoxylon trugodes TaxID=326681 RepID=UPI002191D3A9|nr:uncharacterized protein F4822DRAFT_400366 [Hypoxylon trugodes]KAI1389963.1 hypothetical protein F4822DRAFT_400366 [Hypoxylon trugodes]
MANGSNSYLCGLFHSRPRPTHEPPRDDSEGLRGVEFSPRASVSSSIVSPLTPDPTPAQIAFSRAQAQATPRVILPATNLNNPEIAGYYSPPAPPPPPRLDPTRELRGYYAPEPAPIRRMPQQHIPRPVAQPVPVRPEKMTYS